MHEMINESTNGGGATACSLLVEVVTKETLSVILIAGNNKFPFVVLFVRKVPYFYVST